MKQNKKVLECLNGFHSSDGTIEELVEWGFEIDFMYNGTEYSLNYDDNGNRAILSGYRKYDLIATGKPGEVLNSMFLGKTVKEILNEAEILAYH